MEYYNSWIGSVVYVHVPAFAIETSKPPKILGDDMAPDDFRSTTVVVPPSGGTIVLLDSRRIRHRVLPCHRDRLAITQWFVSPELEPAPLGWKRQFTMKQKKKRGRIVQTTTASGGAAAKRSVSSRTVQTNGDFCHVYNSNGNTNHGTTGNTVDDRMSTNSEPANNNNNYLTYPAFSFNFY
jgi:hypothetical protein